MSYEAIINKKTVFVVRKVCLLTYKLIQYLCYYTLKQSVVAKEFIVAMLLLL